MKKKEKNDIFFQVFKESFKTSEGIVDLPILYYDVNLFLVFYFVEPANANLILKKTDLEAVRFYNQKTLVAIALFEYNDTTVGVYNEIGIAIASHLKEQKVNYPLWELLKLMFHRNPENIQIGFYVAHLPVTTRKANAAGKEIWGYPKFVTNIDLDFNREQQIFNGTVVDPKTKKTIFHIESELKNSFFKIPAFDLLTYTYLENNLIKTHVNVSGNFNISFNNNCKITNVISQHPMAETIKILNLENLNPYLILHSNNWQSRLNKGTIIKSNQIPDYLPVKTQKKTNKNLKKAKSKK